MAKNKTTATVKSVDRFISTLDDETKRDDTYELIKIYKSVTGEDAKMWGPSIIGFGSYHYKYESGHEGDMCLAGFSPRKSAFALYIMNFDGKEALLKKLGKHKPSKGCVYIKKLADIDTAVLKKMIEASVKHTKKKYA
ncbi:MAG TPA: DUF1801 domain-containing protein [Cyclobacteriaceae bacterium]|jgi:hypothetical protein|nr:DUF1801 domain-containing protein [Cyclobacteriaceae bacterium]